MLTNFYRQNRFRLLNHVEAAKGILSSLSLRTFSGELAGPPAKTRFENLIGSWVAASTTTEVHPSQRAFIDQLRVEAVR